MNAPLPILVEGKRLLKAAKDALGTRWSEVEQLYPEYREKQDRENKIDLQWGNRCCSCMYWKGDPSEWQSEDLDIQEIQWCERFKLDQTSRPEECPDYSEKGDLN